MAQQTRTETDTFGPIEVASDRYWGAQAQRSLGNFRSAGKAAVVGGARAGHREARGGRSHMASAPRTRPSAQPS